LAVLAAGVKGCTIAGVVGASGTEKLTVADADAAATGLGSGLVANEKPTALGAAAALVTAAAAKALFGPGDDTGSGCTPKANSTFEAPTPALPFGADVGDDDIANMVLREEVTPPDATAAAAAMPVDEEAKLPLPLSVEEVATLLIQLEVGGLAAFSGWDVPAPAPAPAPTAGASVPRSTLRIAVAVRSEEAVRAGAGADASAGVGVRA
jgi:hypothetical protein